MATHAVLETDEALNPVERLRIEAHFAAYRIDVLILPPGVRVAFIDGDDCPTEPEE